MQWQFLQKWLITLYYLVSLQEVSFFSYHSWVLGPINYCVSTELFLNRKLHPTVAVPIRISIMYFPGSLKEGSPKTDLIPRYVWLLGSWPQDGCTDTSHRLPWLWHLKAQSRETAVSEAEDFAMWPFLYQRRKPSQALSHMPLVRTKLTLWLEGEILPPHLKVTCFNTWYPTGRTVWEIVDI